jgi:hypothetical protein
MGCFYPTKKITWSVHIFCRIETVIFCRSMLAKEVSKPFPIKIGFLRLSGLG